MQTKAVKPASAPLRIGARPVPAIVHDVLRSPGQPLDAESRAFMEPRFGHDFADVRIHHDGQAAQSARAVRAQAYTVGQHVVFETGKFAANTRNGRELLAHELAHTVQQRSLGNLFAPSSAAAEGAATGAARDVMQNADIKHEVGACAVGLARSPIVEDEEKDKGKLSATSDHGALSDADMERLSEANPIEVTSSARKTQGDASAQKEGAVAQIESTVTQAAPAAKPAAPTVAPTAPAAEQAGAPVDQKLDAALKAVSKNQMERRARIKEDRNDRLKFLEAHREWAEVEIPVDDSLRKVEVLHLPYELDVRFFKQVLSIGREDAEALMKYMKWTHLRYDPHVTHEKLQVQKTITYKTDSLRLVQEYYEEMMDDRQLRLREIDEILNSGPDMAAEMFKDVGRGMYNGAIGFGQGIVDLPAAPYNLIQSIRGKDQFHLVNLDGLRADYQTNYGYHQGHSIELGTILGLSLITGKIGGGGGGAGAAVNTVSQVSRAARLLSIIAKVNTVSAGANAVVQAGQAIRDLARGYVIDENGEQHPLTEDEILDRVVAIAYGGHAVKSGLNVGKRAIAKPNVEEPSPSTSAPTDTAKQPAPATTEISVPVEGGVLVITDNGWQVRAADGTILAEGPPNEARLLAASLAPTSPPNEGSSSGGTGANTPIVDNAPAAVDPYARTEQVPAQSPQVQRGHAPIGSARTLRPDELAAQTSATQQQHAAPPAGADPHARTEQITPDSGGAHHGNVPIANQRTLAPEELAREQAKTERMTGENPGNAPGSPAPSAAGEPPVPLTPGPIRDPVAASQALARASRQGLPFRLINNDPNEVQRSWESEGHHGEGHNEAAPPAWVDANGKLTVDTTRVRATVRSDDVLSGPIQEVPAAPPLGQTQDSIPSEPDSQHDADDNALPPPYVPSHSAPPEVTEVITDPQTAQELYWQQHSQYMSGETDEPAAFTNDRPTYDANWKLAHGEGESSPAAWRDQYGRLNVDATRVNIHEPPEPSVATNANENAGPPSGPTTKPLAAKQESAPANHDQAAGNKTAPIATQKAEAKPVDSSIPGEMYRVNDSLNSKFYAQGRVGSHGELEIDLRTELADGSKSTVLKGREQFSKIVAFFKGGFTAIKGNWQFGTNLDKVNELTAKGSSIEEAAGQTWTAGQARDLGFTKVRVLGSDGTPGNYTSVKVLFEKK